MKAWSKGWAQELRKADLLDPDTIKALSRRMSNAPKWKELNSKVKDIVPVREDGVLVDLNFVPQDGYRIDHDTGAITEVA